MTSPPRGVEPLVTLATSIHAQPGVYALLLGSGVSTAAGIPTGWGVVTELVRRIAAATEPENQSAPAAAAADPEGWWREHGDGTALSYSGLLGSLAATPASRRGLLASFFEPTDEEVEQGLKTPTAAHRAVAQMAARGAVRVILTTNFDRLLERALEEAGVPPQVVSRPEAVVGMTPLQHMPITVIKLHGDYADLGMRNTVDELDVYPAEWQELLRRVLTEYGLVIAGWSAAWDTALVRELESDPVRRYPLYWDERSSKGEAARRLLAQHRGLRVNGASADDMFTGLLARLDALDRLAEPPLTTALAITRLKRFLPDPSRRIDLHDLVMDVANTCVDRVAAHPLFIPGLTAEQLQETYAVLLEDVRPVLALLAAGVRHDRDDMHLALWVETLQRLLQARTTPQGQHQEPLDRARHIPALLALRTAGLIAVSQQRDQVLLELLTRPTWRDPFDGRAPQPAVDVLHDFRVMDGENVNKLPRWEGQRWIYPLSHLLRIDLRQVVLEYLPSEADYAGASDGYEYRVALAQLTLGGDRGYGPGPGEFILEGRWRRDEGPASEVEFRAQAQQAPASWPWWPLLGGPEGLDATLLRLRERLQQMQRW